MKKFLLLLVGCISVSSIAFSQTREYEDWYLLPEPFYIGCTYYGSDNVPLTLDIDPDKLYVGFSPTFSEYYSYDKTNQYFVGDMAQRFETDTTIKVIGISALFSNIYYGQMHGYLCLTDDSLNVLQKIKLESCYDTIDETITIADVSDHYTELFFDTSISVNGKFYIMVDNPKPSQFFPDEYNWDEGINYHNNQTLFYTDLYTALCWNSTNVVLFRMIVFQRDENNNYSYGNNIIKWEQSTNKAWYLFPILADTTITDTTITDSSSIANIVDNYTFIFPNPANKEINIQCSFRMQALELFNEQGAKVDKWEIDAYHYLLNIENYPKGNYILKIKTKSGSATKKIIVQ